MIKKFIRIGVVLGVIALLVWAGGGVSNFFKATTAYAVGDLTVDWGVPEGNPIFVVNNFAPGEIRSRNVIVQNDSSASRPVAIRGIQTALTDSFADVLEITISEGGTDLYGPVSLEQFFVDSTLPNFVALSALDAGNSTTYDINVKFMDSAGNEFQNQNVGFDLKIGIAFDVPQECANLTFSGEPIFGTDGNDRINGTLRNDLIVGLEGDDVISGGNGNDCIIGGNGNNKLSGGNGKDVIVSGNGNNVIAGGNGKDVITTGEGTDKIEGGNDADQINSGGGNDTIKGGNGNDGLDGGTGTDNIDGGNGRDTCSAEIETRCEL